MKKLIIAFSILFSLSFSIDPITPIFLSLGADSSQILHFYTGEIITDTLEDNFSLTPFQSFLCVYTLAEIKEQIDINTGSFRNPKDIEWTLYGWLMKRFLTWEIKF